MPMRPLSSRFSVFDKRVLRERVGAPATRGSRSRPAPRRPCARPAPACSGHDGRVVLANVLTHAGAHIPVVGELVTEIELLRRRYRSPWSCTGCPALAFSCSRSPIGSVVTCRRSAACRSAWLARAPSSPHPGLCVVEASGARPAVEDVVESDAHVDAVRVRVGLGRTRAGR